MEITFTHQAPHLPPPREYLEVHIDDLIYDLDNPRLYWITGKGFKQVEQYETALKAHTNYRKFMKSIAQIGIIHELVVTAVYNKECLCRHCRPENKDAKDRRHQGKFLVKGGNTRLLAARELNKLCLEQSLPPIIDLIVCICFDEHLLAEAIEVVQTVDHRIPAKAWPLAERVRTCWTMWYTSDKLSTEEIGKRVMLKTADVEHYIEAGDLFNIYLKISKTDWEESEKKLWIFVQAASIEGKGVFFDWIRTDAGRKEFCTWVTRKQITNAKPEVVNLQRIMDGKGLAFVQRHLTASRPVKTINDLLRELTLAELKSLGIKDTSILMATATVTTTGRAGRKAKLKNLAAAS